ncbi:MAG TPA: aminotransferase class V-fold PLP-dependent enzyme [Planctomycetaceae bacterium]|nr:aminotransferase class V-fold PLP-dependent enzyme [Planctomycetaceae bacterium]
MQPTQLYLDTARLGQMSPRAQQAQLDFTRLAGEEGGSLWFERFLQTGCTDWSRALEARYPGLRTWRGIGPLKADLRRLAGSRPELPLLMVNRSTQLMRFAARLLVQRCRNIFVTDAGWLPYRAILDEAALRTSRSVTVCPLNDLVLRQGVTEDELIEVAREQFLRSDCDGLFLTAVSHLGVRLPVERLVRTLESIRELRFVVVDGAQDFCHASAALSHEYCDLYLASCHKWLRGFHPLGLGFYGRNRSRGVIETLLTHALASGELDDPLLRFTTQLEAACLDGETETVNLMPLFTCQGAATDALEPAIPLLETLHLRQEQARQAAALAPAIGWDSLMPAEPFQTGILLLQADRSSTRAQTPAVLRERFAAQGVALSAYQDGAIRLSMTGDRWQPGELDTLADALRAVA